MPRIEIIPKSYDPKSGDGSPTLDVCKSCAPGFVEGESLGNSELNDVREQGGVPDIDDEELPTAIVGSTDVDHPTFDDEDYECGCCGNQLTSADD